MASGWIMLSTFASTRRMISVASSAVMARPEAMIASGSHSSGIRYQLIAAISAPTIRWLQDRLSTSVAEQPREGKLPRAGSDDTDHHRESIRKASPTRRIDRHLRPPLARPVGRQSSSPDAYRDRQLFGSGNR